MKKFLKWGIIFLIISVVIVNILDAGNEDFRESFVEEWNHELEQIQDDIPEEYENLLDENWWSWLDLNESDIEPRNAPYYQDNTDGGDIYDVTFGDNIKVNMTIYNPPPIGEVTKEDLDLSRFRIVVELVEDLSEVDSTNQFLSRRRQAVQTMDLALRMIFGANNYNREALYNYISDFSEDSWNIGEVNLDFEYADWGYYVEEEYDNYKIILEVGETGNYESWFSVMFNFELN